MKHVPRFYCPVAKLGEGLGEEREGLGKNYKPSAQLPIPSSTSTSTLTPPPKLILSPEQEHHLLVVLRRGVGDELLLFNESSGEWRAIIKSVNKKSATLAMLRQERPAPPPQAKIILYIALLEKSRLDMVIPKAVELGATDIIPVITDFTDRKADEWQKQKTKWQKVATNAAEQAGRLTIANLQDAIRLDNLIATPLPSSSPISQADSLSPPLATQPPHASSPPISQADSLSPPLATQPPHASSPPLTTQPPHASSPPLATQPPHASSPPLATHPPHASSPPLATQPPPPIIYGDEKGGANFYQTIASLKDATTTDIALLVGPPGGFSDREHVALAKHKNFHGVNLGQHILRSETAALAMLAGVLFLYKL